MIGGASILLDVLIEAGSSLWEFMQHPAVVGIVFGGLALFMVWSAGKLVWDWFRSKGNEVVSQLQNMELQEQVLHTLDSVLMQADNRHQFP